MNNLRLRLIESYIIHIAKNERDLTNVPVLIVEGIEHTDDYELLILGFDKSIVLTKTFMRDVKLSSPHIITLGK